MDLTKDDENTTKHTELNRKILEIKKKIQLSEGQRKALFEDCEAERKSNADEILKLKKEITRIVTSLHSCKSASAKYRLSNKRIDEIIGPLSEKTGDQVKELLDLQVIDKSKKNNLLHYRVHKRKKYIDSLEIKYQKILNKIEQKQLDKKIEKPVKKKTCEIQNNIHAVEVQIREALHIRNQYVNIKISLKADSAKFESRIKYLEEKLEAQNMDINKLQKIMEEATKRRNKARGNLVREEKTVTLAANSREREADEGKRLVNERKTELEMLEKRLFIGGKIPTRPEPEGAEAEGVDDEKSSTPPHPVEQIAQDFEQLKQATGGTNSEEVLERFQAQKDTENRLTLLRQKAEHEKKKLEKQVELFKSKLEGYKFAEVRDAERKTGEMERIQEEISKQEETLKKNKEEKEQKEKASQSILTGVYLLYLCINPLAVSNPCTEAVIENIKNELNIILEKKQHTEIISPETEMVGNLDDEERLPAPYSGLIRRTPLPQAGPSPAPQIQQASDDEEDVPSRGFLKRQAQLVVDAKSRRKNIRIQNSFGYGKNRKLLTLNQVLECNHNEDSTTDKAIIICKIHCKIENALDTIHNLREDNVNYKLDELAVFTK